MPSRTSLSVLCLLIHLGLTLASFQAIRTRRPDTRMTATSLSNDIVETDYIQNLDYGEKHVVVFQTSYTALPLPINAQRDTSLSSLRARTQKHEEDSHTTIGFQSNDEFLQEVRRNDPSNKLFHVHGFTYLGRVAAHLPDFHMIERNISASTTETKSDEPTYQDHLRSVFGATWISSQTPQSRPLRRTRDSKRPSNAPEKHKVEVEARTARRMERKRISQKKRENTEIAAKDLRFSTLRRNALMQIHPMGPAGRTASSSWSSRRLQSIQEELRTSYERTRVPSDPLVKDQWFLHGGNFRPRGRPANPRVNYYYLDVFPQWESRIDGRGVVISVVDDGVNFIHSDLADKFVPLLSTDLATPIRISKDRERDLAYNEKTGQFESNEEHDKRIEARLARLTKYGLPLVGQFHGTGVASIAAGSPSDGTCGTGVAPGAMLSSVRVIGASEASGSGVGEGHMLTEVQEALALSYKCINLDHTTGKQKIENMIFVVSWGPEDSDNQTPTSASKIVEAAIQGCVEYGRHGYGSIYVQAAGNGKQKFDSSDLDGYASMRYTISVGSISSTGYPLRYSEGGESLLVVTPSSDGKRGITTATTMGSFYHSRMDSIQHYEDEGLAPGEVMDNAETGLGSTGCTTKFGGTSASAPMIAGVVAMMLQANPKLSWKDVQDILIRSCRPIHYEDADPEVAYTYREILPIRLAQDRGDTLFLKREKEPLSGGTGDEQEIALDHSLEILDHIKRSLYIFYDPMDPLEWSENRETGLYHSRAMGFGMPSVGAAIAMAQKRGKPEEVPENNILVRDWEPSLNNDYAVRSHNIVQNMVHFDFSAYATSTEEQNESEKKFLKRAGQGDYYDEDGTVRHNEIGAWHVQLTPKEHPMQVVYDNSEGFPPRNPHDMVIEHVELYVNATMPASIANTQIALCDRKSLCSLFIQGMPYARTKVISQELDYTFTSVKYWGQLDPYDGAWIVAIRNIFPTRSGALNVRKLTLTIYGHYP